MTVFLGQENALVSDLMRNYNKLVAPVSFMDRSSDRPVEKIQVNITVTYAKLIILNETENTVSSYATLFAQYNDVRLRWDPARHNGIQMILMNKMALWFPDIAAKSALEENQMRASEVENIVVFYNGSCASSFTGVVKLLCSFNLHRFPFDSQTCVLNLQSINYLESEIVFNGFLSPSFNNDDMDNGAWTFQKMNIYRDVYVNPYTHGRFPMVWRLSEKEERVQVVFEMTLSRSSTFYIALIIIPSFILTTLTVLSMFWSCVTKENYIRTVKVATILIIFWQISLGFSSELSQLTLLQIGSQKIPRSENLPALSTFILWNFCILAGSIFAVLFTNWLFIKFPVIQGSAMFRHRFQAVFYCSLHVVFLIVFGMLSLVNFVNLFAGK